MKRIRYIFATLLLILLSQQTVADNQLIVNNLTAMAASTNLSVSLENSDDIVGLQFDIALPEGTTIVSDPILSNRSTDHVATVRAAEGSSQQFHVLIYSPQNNAFTGNSGEIITMPIVLPIELAMDSEFDVTLDNVIIGKADGSNVVTGTTSGKITIGAQFRTIFNLNVGVLPANSGSINRSSQDYEVGNSIYMNAYTHTDFQFVNWTENGRVVSTSRSFYYTMPAYDVQLIANFAFRPDNPGNPDAPDQTKAYQLTLNTVPANAGSFNRSSGEQHKAGESVYMYYYNNTDFRFKYWLSADTVISSDRYFYFTMPDHDATLTAVYDYVPGSPANPDTAQVYYNVFLETQPANAGSFSWSNNTQRVAGSSGNIYAYNNTDYVFREWQQDGVTVSTDRQYNFTMPAHNIKLVAVYDYRPGNPGNPGANYWNVETGEVIVDDFTSGYLNDAVYYTTNGNHDAVQMMTVAGPISQYDWGIVNNYGNCTFLDLSRTYGMTYVPSYNFYGNQMLTTVALPASIETIDYYAFYGCSSLSSISCYAASPPAIGTRAFEGIADSIVYVPADAISLYQEADGWKDFTILPLAKEVSALEVNLPEGTNVDTYKDMYVELINNTSGQKQRYVVTNRLTYTFNSLVHRTSYHVYLKNAQGDVLGQIDNIDIVDHDVSVTFESLMVPRDLKLMVLTPEGQDVTAQTTITWYDRNNTYLTRGNTLTGQLEGNNVTYRVQLPQTLAMQYLLPADVSYKVQETNNISLTLANIPQTTVSGRVLDVKTGQALSGATVAVSQMLNGMYSKSFTTKTDNQGLWSLQVFEAKTDITASMTDYVSKTQLLDTLVAEIPDFLLKDISGTTISLNLTYTATDGETQEYYSDYANVAYAVYNETTGQQVTELNVQYPQIVLMEQLPAGTVLRVEATSKNQKFMPVTATATVDDLDRANVILPIVQLGGISASFKQTDNTSVVGILYDANGRLLKKYDYATATLTISELQDGQYTLVTMASTQLFNTVGSISQFAETGLREGVDYVKNNVTVCSGEMVSVENALIPFLDETKLYYTSDGTSVSVNKSQITTGNYLTITGHLDFKPVYADLVSDVKLIFNLPEECAFVDNSVMRGGQIATYTYEDNKVVVPLDYYGERVRFCFIPTAGGDFAATASVQFILNGKTVNQPIGNTNFTVKNLSIQVPSIVAKTSIPVSGTAVGKSTVSIYDNGILVGQTTSLANGSWATTIELDNPFNLSNHSLYATIKTPAGVDMQTETQIVQYNKDAIEMRTVTMSFYNGWLRQNISVVFDFENGRTSTSSYMFYTGTDVTFVADLTNNDTTVVSAVTLYVYTDRGEIRELHATYDKKTDKWVAVDRFESNNLPINISTSFVANEITLVDRQQFDLYANHINEKADDAKNALADVAELEESANTIDQSMIEEQQTYESLSAEIANTESGAELDTLLVQWLTLAGIDASVSDFMAELPETVDESYIQSLINKANELLADDGSQTPSVDDLMTQIDEVLDDTNDEFDYISSLQSALSDTINVDTQNGIATLYRTTLEKYGNIKFEVADTIRLDLTDSTAIYVFMSIDDEVLIVDSLKNQLWYIHDKQVTAEVSALRLVKKAGKAGFVSAMNAARQKIEWLGNVVLSAVKEWISHQEEIRKGLLETLDAAKTDQSLLLGESSGKAIRIKEIEKEIKALTSSDVISLDEYFEVVERDELIKQLEAERTQCLKKIQKNQAAIKQLEKKVTKLTAKITAVAAVLGELHDLYEVGRGIFTTISYINTSIQDHGHWYSLIDRILPCENDLLKAQNLKKKCENDWSDIAWRKGYYPAFTITGLMTVVNGYMMTNKAAKIVARLLISAITDFLNNTAEAMFYQARNASLQWYPIRYAEYRSLKCKKDKKPDGHDEPDKPHDPNDPKLPPTLPPVEPIHDPSGYVYEGVASNRLQGVTATAYYKETVEDMYGDLHENIVLWDAAEYAQENPLFTDEFGMYQWDVPQGLWQVKFEKEGYQTTYSEWLPVPPPQLEVNIAMTQLLQPSVVSAKAYDEGVEVTFDKYMNPESLTTGNIFVTRNGEKTEGIIELLNEEAAYEGQTQTYASKVRFTVPEDAPLLSTDEVQLTVRKSVESYAGVRMEQDYTQAFDVEPKVRTIAVDSLINVAYGGERTLTVAALPADASKGKKMVVKSLSQMIATVSADTLTLDENGQAELKVNGELPGSTVISFVIEGTDVTGNMAVNVKDEANLVTLAPRASRVSGTEVYRGTEIRLTSETDGAEIWYTLDGSCPCNIETALKYNPDEPIIITEDSVTIKAMAQGHDLAESDVTEFTYTLKKTTLGYTMPVGWTWISHNVEEAVSTSTFQTGAERIVSQTQEIINDPKIGFIGNLTELQPVTGYKVQQKTEGNVRLAGNEWNAANQTVPLTTGWNWIGYPLNQAMTVSEALTFFSPSDGDYLVGQNGFAEYADGQWHGTLEGMVPGEGFLYKSNSENEITFNTTIVSVAASRLGKKKLLNGSPWAVNKYAYPNVTPLTAWLYDKGTQTSGGDYIVAAFSDSECRGVGIWQDDRLLMNIYGDGGEQLQFMAYDPQTESVYDIAETFTFDAEPVGSWRMPYAMNISGEAVDVDELYASMTVTPRVIYDHLTVTVNGRNVNQVTLTDMGGRVVANAKGTGNGDATVFISQLPEGVYIVTAVADGRSYYQKIVKSNK